MSVIRTRLCTSCIVFASLAILAAPALSGATPWGNPTIKPKRDTEPIVLSGELLGGWTVPANTTAKVPLTDFPEAGECALDDWLIPNS